MHITWREKTLCIVFFEFRFDAAFKEGSPLAGLLVVYTYSLKMFSGYTRSIYLISFYIKVRLRILISLNLFRAPELMHYSFHET